MSLVYRFQLPGKVLDVYSVDASSPEAAIVELLSPSSDGSDDKIAPGYGEISIEPVVISSQKLANGQTVLMSSRVRGKNVAYIFAELFLQDKKGQPLYGPVFRQYIRANNEEESQGMCYPLWEEDISLSYALDPVIKYVTDGQNHALCALKPERYGTEPDVERSIAGGIYAFANGSRRRARVVFGADGVLKQVFVFKGATRTGAPASTMPKPGDQFTPYVNILTPSPERDGKWVETLALGSALTFGNEPLHVISETLPEGFYRAGFMVQDLDGNQLRQTAGFGM